MRKLLILLFALLILDASARRINPEDAVGIAKEYLEGIQAKQSRSLPEAINVQPVSMGATSENEETAYYVFNASESKGFVIISADDRLPKIIGYSAKGNFNPDNIPPQLQHLLNIYQDELKNAASMQIHKSWLNTDSDDKKAVLLETAEWNQFAPYNDMCPVINGEKSVTGCGPTAMAIIMKYHNWPERGRGYHHTPCLDGFIGSNEVEFDFNTDFDYSAMLNKYDENSSEASKNAVAKLMLAAGAASCANYGLSVGTMVMETQMIRGLKYYLRYSPKMTTLSLESSFEVGLLDKEYSRKEFEDSIIAQLNKNLPVLGGTYDHTFVIDGYDSNGLLHINWGWGGFENGYYSVPDAAIGTITINIEPDRSETPISRAHMYDTDFSVTPARGGIDLKFPWLNISSENITKGEPFDCVSGYIYFPTHFKGEYGLAIVDAQNHIKEIVWSQAVDYSSIDSPWSQNIDVRGIKASVDIEDKDRLQIVTLTEGEEEWALVTSTRQVATSAPCKGFTPIFSDIDWNIFGNVEINGWAYSDEIFHSSSELPRRILLGCSLIIKFDKAYSLYELDKLDYRIAVGLNDYFRDICKFNPLRLYLYDKSINFTIDSYMANETVNLSVALNEGESISDKITTKEALRVNELTVSGPLKQEDLDFIDTKLPYVTSLNLKDATIIDNDVIPSKFYTLGVTLKQIWLPLNVKQIQSYAFSYCNMSEVYIPASVEYIGNESFGRNPDLKDLWVENPMYDVNHLSNSAFWESTENCTLHVPASEVETCRNHAFWSRFKEIVPFTPGVIDNVTFKEPELNMYVGDKIKSSINVTPYYYEDELITWT